MGRPNGGADGLYLLSDRTHDRGALLRVDPATGEMTEIFRRRRM